MNVPDPDKIHQLRIADLPTRKVTRFNLTPTKAELQRLQTDLDLLGLSKVRLTGTLQAVGKSDWVLKAQLGATVVQPCTATLVPVTTRLDDEVLRRYSPDALSPDEDVPTEMEMPEDDSLEPLPQTLDLMEVLSESLVLALPLYPRAAGAALMAKTAQPKGSAPIADETLKPFAALSTLRDALSVADATKPTANDPDTEGRERPERPLRS